MEASVAEAAEKDLGAAVVTALAAAAVAGGDWEVARG